MRKTFQEELTSLAINKKSVLDCLVILSHLNNHAVSLTSLKAGLPLEEEELTPELLKRVAARINIDADIILKNIEDLSNEILPCILIFKQGDACVLQHIEKNSAQVIFSGGDKTPRSMPLSELKKKYEGKLILVHYKADEYTRPLSEESGIQKNWFWSTLLEFWPIYSHVILASFFINFFTLASTIFVMAVYDRVVPNNALATLWVLAIGVTIIFVFDFILRVLRGYFLDTAGRNADILLASRLYEHILGMRLDARPKSSGALAHQLREFETLREFISSMTVSTLIDLLFIFFFIFIIWLIAGPVALVPLFMVPIVIGVSYLLQKPLSAHIQKSYAEGGQKHALLVQSLQGLETIKGLGIEGKMQHSWENFVAQSASTTALSRFFSSLAIHLSMLAQNLTVVGVMIVGVYEISEQRLTMGGLIACSILAGRAMGPLTQVVSLLTRLNQSLESLKKLNQIIQLPVERICSKRYVHRPLLEGNIEFKNVTFAYPGNENPVLKDVSFTIKAGEKIALLGRIGSGKTTLEKLILGFYKPQSGSILIDGVDINQIDPAELRTNIGYIPQDIFLFKGSLRHNISLGGDAIDDESLLQAAKISGTHDFVSQHPLGYELPVGEGGAELSGGQRQTIAIARALVRKPSILLFDEPSAMMDNTSEMNFIQRLQELIQTKVTLILVTHRPTLLALADRILIIDNGRVVADGPKEAILEALRTSTIKTDRA